MLQVRALPGTFMLSNRSQTSPFRVGDTVYLRVKVTPGFEQPVVFVNHGTDEKPDMRCERGPELAWVQLIDRKGVPVSECIYGVPPDQLIIPSAVLNDMKETKK
jgi:hypothetical protein